MENTNPIKGSNMPENRDNQIRRTARLLEIIYKISGTPRFWTRRRLAENYEISERMIQKDLELIRVRLGLELQTDGEGYYFSHLPQMPTTSFSFSEAIALLAAAHSAQRMSGINSTELNAAIARLEVIFPSTLRPFLKDSFNKLPENNNGGHHQTILQMLYRAYSERLQIKIVYYSNSSQGTGERIVEPYAIMAYGRSWVLIGFDYQRHDILQFKLDRIQSGEILDQHYQIPSHFNLEKYYGDGWGLMRGAAGPAEQIVLHFNELAGRWVSEENWHKSQVNEIQEDGSFIVRFYAGVTPETINWLLYYGTNVRIIEPEWLREKVKEEHRFASEMTA